MSTDQSSSHSTSQVIAVPPCIAESWRLGTFPKESELRKQLEDCTVSSLSKACIDLQLQKYFSQRNAQHTHSTPSLSSLSIGSILDALNTSSDLKRDASIIIDNLSSTTLRQVLNDPRLRYQIFRVLLTLLPSRGIKDWLNLVDIDEVILRRERYVRSRGDAHQNGRYLLRLEDLPDLNIGFHFSMGSTSSRHNVLSLNRPDIPKGGLEVLDYVRNQNEIITINATDQSFCRTFEKITHGILKGLDWGNVFIAGGMALTTLMHTDPSKDQNREITDPDLDLYIYGLGPEDANAKVQHIYETWSRNVPSSSPDRLVVKNAKTINLLASYPNRRIQIVLKLLPSPTDILLNFDLDACAVGFDGSQVLMLPRFVRALETGYSVFTMDLVWGHHLGDRRATQDARVFKYADRGFGLRILPSYAKSLEENITTKVAAQSLATQGAEFAKKSSHDDFRPRDRFPHGAEPGLKTLKRIFYLGLDFVHRFLFGATPLALSPEQIKKSLDPRYVIDDDYDHEWQRKFKVAQRDESRNKTLNNHHRAHDQPCEGPSLDLADLDGDGLRYNLPNGRRGLGNFEIFMRHCEAWRLDACGDATLIADSFASTAYDDEVYDDLPAYTWGRRFDIGDFASSIESSNAEYWTNTKIAICHKVSHPVLLSGFSDYSTRRVRRQVFGPDLATVLAKQITIPVIIPHDLEDYILHALPSRYPSMPEHTISQPCLIPVHDSANTQYTGAIPSLADSVTESGNLRFWVIDNNSMWASQHRVVDEISEILWALFYWLNGHLIGRADDSPFDTSHFECLTHMVRSLRRRIVLPEVPDDDELGPGSPGKREACLFRTWALDCPRDQNRSFVEETGRHELFNGGCIRYPFEDELFWKGDEEELGKEGAKVWLRDR